MQILRPVSDHLVSGWSPTPASPPTLWDKITDGGGVPDDGKIVSSDSGTFIEQEMGVDLAPGSTPAAPGTCTAYLAVAKQSGSPALQDVRFEIRQGGSTVAGTTFPLIADTVAELSFTFSSALVSNWSTLWAYVRRLATASGCFIYVAHLRLQAPDPPSGFAHLARAAGTGVLVAAAGSGTHLQRGAGAGVRVVTGLEAAGSLIRGSAGSFKVST